MAIRGGVEVEESSAIAIACISYIRKGIVMRTRWVKYLARIRVSPDYK